LKVVGRTKASYTVQYSILLSRYVFGWNFLRVFPFISGKASVFRQIITVFFSLFPQFCPVLFCRLVKEDVSVPELYDLGTGISIDDDKRKGGSL
jgi:hypothetical protein